MKSLFRSISVKQIVVSVSLSACVLCASAQYAPAAGQQGTTAIYKDSIIFKGWATTCTVQRGSQDISDPDLGYASAGEPSMATGKAGTNGVVSLGDGGMATLTFEKPITNGPGNDFAVFENGFSEEFLELAFVEVSSDGISYFRFPSVSLTDASVQMGSFDAVDARKIHNLAGKYRAFYGTPFDLEDLKDQSGLDENAITHIRIVDVVGSIDNRYATYDKDGNKVNDPWPTPFEAGGFDLDAVGVIHFAGLTAVRDKSSHFDNVQIYPNPLQKDQEINVEVNKLEEKDVRLQLLNVSGEIVKEQSFADGHATVSTEGMNGGIYILKMTGEGETMTRQLVIY